MESVSELEHQQVSSEYLRLWCLPRAALVTLDSVAENGRLLACCFVPSQLDYRAVFDQLSQMSFFRNSGGESSIVLRFA